MSTDEPQPEDPTRESPAPPDAATRLGADGDPVAPPAPAPGLYRSEADRMLFGVCGGIAERYGLEPLLVRLGFLATLFIGGAGILFYLAAALLIPRTPDGVVAPGRASGPAVSAAGGVLRLLVGIAAAIGIFAVLCAVAAVSFGLTAFFGAWPVAAVLLVVGALLIVSARSRRATGALLVLALALAVPATGAVVGGVAVARSVGERNVRPFSIAEASRDRHLGAGRMIVDLRRVPLRRGDRVRIPARVDVGQLGVVLPRTRCVAWTVHVHIGVGGGSDVLENAYDGHVWTGGGSRDRTVEIDPPPSHDDRRPRAILDLHVGLGSLVVADSRKGIDGDAVRGIGLLRHEDADLLRTTAYRAADRAAERR